MPALPNKLLSEQPGMESGSHDRTHSSPFHFIFPFTKPPTSMNGDMRVLFPACIVCISASTQDSGKLAGLISTGSHLALIRMVRLLLFLVPDIITDLLDFLNKKKAYKKRGRRRQTPEWCWEQDALRASEISPVWLTLLPGGSRAVIVPVTSLYARGLKMYFHSSQRHEVGMAILM